MGPTPTPTRTLGMRLSCNLVNVYTIVYHVQYTYTCTCAHPQRTFSRGKARVGEKSADKSANSRRLPREDPRADVGEEVRVGVGVGVRVGPVEFKLIATETGDLRRPVGPYVASEGLYVDCVSVRGVDTV